MTRMREDLVAAMSNISGDRSRLSAWPGTIYCTHPNLGNFDAGPKGEQVSGNSSTAVRAQRGSIHCRRCAENDHPC